MKRRLEYLDIAKGILIIMMLIGHTWDSGPVHYFVYSFHMPAFFLISGMLFHYGSSADKPIWKVILHKARLLLIPYFCFEIFGITLAVLTEGAYLNIKGYIYQIITLTLTNGPLWFIIVLFCGECLVLMVQRFLGKPGIYAATAFLAISIWFMPRFEAYISITTIVLSVFFLCTGYAFKPLLEKTNYWIASGALILVIVLSQINRVEISNYQMESRACLL